MKKCTGIGSLKELYRNFQGYLQLNLPKIKWVIIFGVAFYVLFCFLYKKGCVKRHQKTVTTTICGIVLSLNSSFIFIMTLFGREIRKTHRLELKPFESYFISFSEGDMEVLLQILVNIAMYIPLGFVLPYCFKVFERYRYIILVSIASSMVIELIQLVFRIGWFEVDDIINNTLGAVVGVLIYAILHKVKSTSLVLGGG